MMTSIEGSAVPDQRATGRGTGSVNDVRLELVPRLEWSLATESHPPALEATAPSSVRGSWIHRAPEDQVLKLFRKLDGSARRLPAPWWLPALDRGELPSRKVAFEIEDEVHGLLCDRTGWVFVPWGSVGETGYWEYGPSDREPTKMPTTIVFTNKHPGWLNAIPAHADVAGLPVQVAGTSGLLRTLPRIESW